MAKSKTHSREYRIAYEYAKGAVDGALYSLGFFALIVVLVHSILHVSGCSMDATDTSATERSGLRLHIDAETGVHYLSTPAGHLIVREKQP